MSPPSPSPALPALQPSLRTLSLRTLGQAVPAPGAFATAQVALRPHQWFFHPDLTADAKLLYTDPAGRILARERVSTYAFYNGYYPRVAYYAPKLHWAGDQGLMLNAMVDLAPIVQSDILYTVARGILEGVRSLLVNSQGILQPWIPAGESFQGDSHDYSTGVGVYMRYLLYAFQCRLLVEESIA